MKSKLLFMFISLSQIVSAQTFTEATNTPFDGVSESAIAFADVDRDDNPDLLITGRDRTFEPIAKLYSNTGAGRFTAVAGTPFEGVVFSSIAFADVDGDDDLDLFITGLNSSEEQIAKLYTNDGMGNFTEMMDLPFDGVQNGSHSFADIDGDGDPDLFITGFNTSEGSIAKLYTNDGNGNFIEKTDTPFDGVSSSSIAFADVDGDNHPDLLITGLNSSAERIAKLYINDGLGNFTESTDMPFDGVGSGSIAFADVNGDNHPDLLITGGNASGDEIAKLYINDGMGNFTERMNTPFEGVWSGSIAFSDVDGDNDPDLLITGANSSFDGIAKLYINDGSGHFTESMDTPFDGVQSCSIAFSDVDGDNYPDLLITGRNNSNERIAKLYINDGMVSSTDHLSPGVQLELTPYPNPTSSNRLNVRFESTEIGYATLVVYDVNGHLLRQQKELSGIGKQTLCMDIASLPPGSYFIQLNKGKRKGVARFVVQ